MRLKSTRQVLFASAALLTLSAPAFALDGGDVLKKINAAYAAQGGEIAAGSVAVNGDTVTLNGVTFNAAADPAKRSRLAISRLKASRKTTAVTRSRTPASTTSTTSRKR